MNFKSFSDKIAVSFKQIQSSGKLFVSSVTGDELWQLYIDSLKDNPIFRDPNSSSHNCNLDRSFIRRYGNVVSLDENLNIITFWDIDIEENSNYYLSCKKMSQVIKDGYIRDLFTETFDNLNKMNYEKTSKKQEVYKLGIETNYKIYTVEEANKFGKVKTGEVYTFNHFYSELNKIFVDSTGLSREAIVGTYRDRKNVFKRGLDEISLVTLNLVVDLIDNKSILDGTAHLEKVKVFKSFKEKYDITSNKDNWCWFNCDTFAAKFKNELIGVFCTEIESLGLEQACENWNKRVDPINYKNVQKPVTKKQLEKARRFVEDNHYIDSFNRRHATLSDIDINEILHTSKGSNKKASIFDNVEISPSNLKIDDKKLVEVNIDTFMNELLPNSKSVEVLFNQKHIPNLVALTTSVNKDCKSIFKWGNNVSYTFKDNIAGVSQIRQAVKDVGGKVDGALRFSITWNETGKDAVDFDLHAFEPTGTQIYYSSSYRKDRGNKKTSLSGQLDVDMISPRTLGVENIIWDDFQKMKPGKYLMRVVNFDGGRNTGFKAEIAFGDNYYIYKPKRILGRSEYLDIATVILNEDKTFSILHHIDTIEEHFQNANVWGLDTNNFYKATLVCTSPNHWGDNNVGNKYYMFMLDGCKSDTPLKSFHNENLNNELYLHKYAMQGLGYATMLEPTESQLCGLGFNETVKDELIVKLNNSKIYKIKF